MSTTLPKKADGRAAAIYSTLIQRVREANHRGCSTTEIDVPTPKVGQLVVERIKLLAGHDAAVDGKGGGQLVVRVWW